MNRSTPTFSLLVPLCLVIAVIVFSLPVVQSQHDAETVIQLVTNKESTNVCARFTTPPASCPVNCFRADPVCGEDGVTYWCGCLDAMCHGVKVVKLGACEVGNGGSSSLPGQALLLVHIVWLVLLGFSLLFGLF